ncbi:MAG: TylF/MycF family methyltransferase [Micavibrio sp.]|nr:TylF/MycF family methyltransferase [Micavibrio sp.]
MKALKTQAKIFLRKNIPAGWKGYLMKYPYMFTPAQMLTLCDFALRAADKKGAFVEIGCAYGNTTIFLNKLFQDHALNVDYHVIDTFSGFTPEDVDYEIEGRKLKPSVNMQYVFSDNDPTWFKEKMDYNGVDLAIHQSDIVKFDFSKIENIAFCLFDVDLYKPTAAVLPTLYEKLVPGGVLVIDDCDKDDPNWNGAYQAYMEFIKEKGLPENIMNRKLGIIQKAS